MPQRETYCWWFRNLAPLFAGFIHPSWCRISSINSVNSTTTQTGKSAKGVLVSQWDIKVKIEALIVFCSVNFWKSSVLPPFFFETKKLWSTWSPVAILLFACSQYALRNLVQRNEFYGSLTFKLKHKSSFEAVFFERPVQRTCTTTLRTLHQPTLWASKDEGRRWVESLLQVWPWWLGECAERQMPKELKVLPFLPSWKCGICPVLSRSEQFMLVYRVSFFSNVTMALVANVGVWSFPASRGIVTWTIWVDLPRPTRFCGVCYQVYWPTLRWFG